MVTKAQAVEIIRMCSEGTPYKVQADTLGVAYFDLYRAVRRMAAAGIDIKDPLFVRRAAAKVKRELSPTPRNVRRRYETKEAKYASRRKEILDGLAGGATVAAIAKSQGVVPSRIYALMRRYEAQGFTVVLPSVAGATNRRIQKTKEWIKHKDARIAAASARDDLLMLRLGLKPTPSP